MKWIALTFGLLLVMIVFGCDDSSAPSPTGAGRAVMDTEKAQQELNPLQSQFQALLDRGGDTASLLAETRQFVERYPTAAAGRLLLGQIHMMRGEINDAGEQYERALEIDPRQPEVRALAGNIAMQTGDLDLAERHFSQAIGLDSSKARYRVLLAAVYLKRNQLDEAQMELLQAIQIDSASHIAFGQLAEVYAKQNEINLALDQISRAVELSASTPKSQQAHRLRKASLLRRANRPYDSLKELMQLPAKRLVEMSVAKQLAECWAMLGEPQKAARHYEEIAIIEPTNDAALAASSQWYFKAGLTEDADRMLTSLRKINPRHEAIETLQEKLDAE